jgi:hypothetical protein
MRYREPAEYSGRAKTADGLLMFGGIFGLLGGLANIAIGVLHFLGIPLPWRFLEWPMFMAMVFPGSIWWYLYVFVPLIIGIVGTLFTLICMSRRMAIRTEPKGTGVALIVCGGVVAGCCWVFGGLLIIFAGIFSILHWSDVRPTRRRPAPRTRPRPVSEPEPKVAPHSTVRVVESPKVAKSTGYCGSCGALLAPDDLYCNRCGIPVD